MFYYAVSEFIIEVYKLILKHVLGQNNNSTIRAVVALHNIEQNISWKWWDSSDHNGKSSTESM